MKKNVMRVCVIAVCMNIFTGCMSSSLSLSTTGKNENSAGTQAESENKEQAEPEQKTETQLEKCTRLFESDLERLVRDSNLVLDDNNRVTTQSLENIFYPQSITSIDEITEEKLIDPGKPYYFKLRTMYKGYDAKTKRVLLQDLKKRKASSDTALELAFGVDTSVYSIDFVGSDISSLPTEANAVATFYLFSVRISDNSYRKGIRTILLFIRDIEEPRLNPANFIVASGMHYITVEDAHSPTREDVMSTYFFGATTGNSSSDVFDPVVYLPVDLMDARAAMNKKDYTKDYTLPTVKVKYVSEVLFLGQSNTTISVSTVDNVLAERMTFIGRTSSIKRGEKIRVYYTIAKDPLEQWEIQAIERL